MKPELLTEIFVRADAEELGLVVETNNTKAFEAALDRHRREAGLWRDLMVLTPSTPGFLFISHRSVELDP